MNEVKNLMEVSLYGFRDLGIEDKVVLITAAASGIGIATTRLLLDEAALVMMSDLKEKALEHTAKVFLARILTKVYSSTTFLRHSLKRP